MHFSHPQIVYNVQSITDKRKKQMEKAVIEMDVKNYGYCSVYVRNTGFFLL